MKQFRGRSVQSIFQFCFMFVLEQMKSLLCFVNRFFEFFQRLFCRSANGFPAGGPCWAGVSRALELFRPPAGRLCSSQIQKRGAFGLRTIESPTPWFLARFPCFKASGKCRWNRKRFPRPGKGNGPWQGVHRPRDGRHRPSREGACQDGFPRKPDGQRVPPNWRGPRSERYP